MKLRILGMGRKSLKNDSLPGSLDMLILKTLSGAPCTATPSCRSSARPRATRCSSRKGRFYPALQRLELHGWIDGEWGVAPSNRRARIYTLTPKGRKQLAQETQRYNRLTLAIGRVMGLG